jgi:predicted ArsR family transcriptional regulator
MSGSLVLPLADRIYLRKNNLVEFLTPGPRRVVAALLDKGAATAVELAAELELTPAAIRHHLDWLLGKDFVVASDQPAFGPRIPQGRGRPSRFFSLTASGRQAFDQRYDDLAHAALSWALKSHGKAAIKEIAEIQMDSNRGRWQESISATGTLQERASELAGVLNTDGYAASIGDTDGPMVQLSFHRCPVESVAKEFPEICEAEMCAIGETLNAHVTRIATIATGAEICTAIIAQPEDLQNRMRVTKMKEGAA